MTPAVRDAAPSRRPRWRFAAVLAVLAGLFLMHGMSATQSCHGSPAAMASMTSASMVAPVEPAADPTSAMTQGMNGGSAAAQVLAPDVGHESALIGDSCVPLRAEESGVAAMMLLALVLTVGFLALANRRSAPFIARWRRPPASIPRCGAELLVSLCVSRT